MIFRSIILNSNISLELYRLNDLSIFSFLVYLTLTGLLMMIPLLAQMLMPALKHLFGFRHNIFSAKSRTVTASVFAVYMVAMAGTLGFKKEQDRVTVWANRLSIDRDISLELELRRTEDKIASDQLIATLSAISNSNSIILNRVIESYMPKSFPRTTTSWWNLPQNGKIRRMIAYITDIMKHGEVPISEGSRFRYMRNSVSAACTSADSPTTTKAAA